jgi:hypothetical protein
MPDPHDAWMAANNAAGPLHDRAILLGYNVGVNAGGQFGQPATASFWVRRIDQQGEAAAQIFATAVEVSEHLDYLATLGRYRLALVNNPRMQVSPDADGPTTWFTDTDTGQLFAMRTADLEGATQLFVHAETPPTIGNWEQA